MNLVQSNCKLKWKRKATLHSLTPEIQSHPLSCPGGTDCSQREAIPVCWVMAKLAQEFVPPRAAPAGLTQQSQSRARAGQARALHSPGPLQQQPGVISEAQPGTAPAARLWDKADYMQSSLKTNLLTAQGASPELSDEILLHFMKLVVLFLQAVKTEMLLPECQRCTEKKSPETFCQVGFYIFPEKWRNSATWGNRNPLRGMKVYWYVTNKATIELKSQNWETKISIRAKLTTAVNVLQLISVSAASSSSSCNHELNLSFWTASLAESWLRKTGKFQIICFIQAREEGSAH